MSSSVLSVGIRRLRGLVAGQHRQDESDEQLLHAFTSRRDESAFAALVRRHGPMVLGVCRRVLGHQQDAEDAFQATFLVLARGATALRRKSALASFLYGTAHRIALTAKRAAARRRKYEGQAPTRTPDDPAGELSWREVQALLDEEIARLPDAYRSVFVLCCLEDLSRTEAARRLGLKEGTVSSRLAEARKRLQQRLARRGLELTALLAATALATPPASALPPAVLTATTSTPVSPQVAALTDAGLNGLSAGKVKLATVILLVGSLLTGAGLWAYRVSASLPTPGLPEEPPAASKGSDRPQAAPPEKETAKGVEVRGRVLGPNGKPKAGTRLLWFGGDDRLRQLGVAAPDGSFTVTLPMEIKQTSRLGDYHPEYLIARCDGYGIDFLSSARLKAGRPVELRLVKDRVIRGRVVNTEGKPVAGASVGVPAMHDYERLDNFLTAWMKWHAWQMVPDGQKRLWTRTDALLATTTDADGRFALHGAGDERVVTVQFGGAGIADAELFVVTRAGFDPKPYNQAVLDHSAQRFGSGHPQILYGPEISFVAEAGKVLCGVVKAADTGKGQPGTVIWLNRVGDDLPQVILHAKTDARGRYEIRGIRKANRYALQVLRNPATGYMGNIVQVEDADGYQPTNVDITVRKGVIVTGKVIDRATGQPLPGDVRIFPLSGNPFAKDYPELHGPRWLFGVESGDDGTFREVTIPGPVLLTGEPDLRRLPGGEVEWLGFKPPVADPQYPQYFQAQPGQSLRYFGLNGEGGVHGNSCKVLDLQPGTAVVRQDVYLDRHGVRTVKVQDAEGQPIGGVWATGLSPDRSSRVVRLKDDACPVYGLKAGNPRLLVFYERGRKLAGVRLLQSDEKQPVAVKLRPAGSIVGRLLDPDGKPLAGVEINAHYQDREAAGVHEAVHEAKRIVSDARGAFALDELIPGLKFKLSFHRGKSYFEPEEKPAEVAIVVEPGESRDLGAIRLKQLSENPGE
jgi:RNA polymerase sigma factor (sigma-70 family)